MNIALAQLEITAGTVQANVDRGVEAIKRAASNGADLIALPELFNVGFFAFDAYEDAAEPINGPTHDRIATLAADHAVWILAGSIIEDLEATEATTNIDVPAATGLANTAVLYDPNGHQQLVYRKAHLWGYHSEEADRLTPGESVTTTKVGGFEVGVTTCYDLRFPELYRALLDDGVELILIPSAWPYPRVEHWRTLSRARAIENLAYVATVNGSGTMGDTTLCGRSAVYDPWGTTVASTGDQPDLIETSIDAERVRGIRNSFPAVSDRRPGDFSVS